MVFFTCDGCNETLKKNQVDAHAARCRRCISVTCVDCSITFYGDDFRAHTTCTMTEVGNLVADRGSQKKNKKQTPQEAWMELLNSSVGTAPPAIKRHLQQMIQLDNVPRKEKQFRNFASNSLNLRGNSAKQVLDAIWNHLSEQREKQKKAKEEQAAIAQQQKQKQQSATEKSKQSTAASTSTPEEAQETKSVSDTENQSSKGSNEETTLDKDDRAMCKDVKKATKKLLKKAPNHSMKYKSLQKALREKLGADKKRLKKVMESVLAKETKKFMMEGKQIKLVAG